ncbi:hypothetical protein OLX02_14385 [Novosphingobium sp. KCTC 2891]|uniref:hypothetical protein n=1 Tax=Novosphingobium sp. KCTC 2891 TaxID=2989730 RepID=UPI0022215DD0|nr:hypothetical protein [Novosphingobium sp. KCTC 2891]MCW1384007.1 hypothetical protein [Novosphingobium sp. KCTC 2891]
MLRVLYRDAASTMLLTLPPGPGAAPPPPSCAAPLLIDPASGAARPLTAQEVTARLRTMQLAGAVHGTCAPVGR